MEVLYFFENIRTPVLDTFFSIVTYFGHEMLFLIFAFVLFWCVDKRAGYYVILVGLSGTILNQLLKMIFRIPRPWVIDPEFTIVEQARAAATGYSFPSGHTQCAVGVFGCIAVWEKKLSIRILALLPIILVPISRMYLGVHTWKDVGVSFILALILVFAFYPLMRHSETKPGLLNLAFCGSFVLAVINILFLTLYRFPSDLDPILFDDAASNAWKLAGAALGVVFVWLIDHHYMHFDTKAVWYAQVFKIILGLIPILIVKELFKIPLQMLLPDSIADAVRYFLIVMTAGTLWPMTFPWFAKLGTGKRNA